MNASWPMVIGALLAGTVGGFMIPVRPEIRDVPAFTASRTMEPAAKKAAAAPVKTEGRADIRKILPAEQNAESAELAPEPKATAAQSTSCERQTWPNQSPNCLDRSAGVAPAETVPARRIDPVAGTAETSEPEAGKPQLNAEAKSAASAEPAASVPRPEATKAPNSEPARPQPKVVSSPPVREERAGYPAQAETQPTRGAREQRTERPARTEQATVPRTDESRTQTTVERDQMADRPRHTSRRVNRDDLDDGIPTRIYLRGPDGRLYLAPEYRPSGRTVYIMR